MTDGAGTAGEPGTAMVEMRLARLAVHTRTREPLAILLEITDGPEGRAETDRCLVISVRSPQAEVLAIGAQPSRADDDRITQDVVADVAAALGRRLDHAAVLDLVDDRFRAALVLDDGTAVTARPSDALALAVRDDFPVRVAAHVLDRAGQSFAGIGGPPEADQVLQLRRLLEGATAEDFRAGGAPPDPADPPGPAESS